MQSQVQSGHRYAPPGKPGRCLSWSGWQTALRSQSPTSAYAIRCCTPPCVLGAPEVVKEARSVRPAKHSWSLLRSLDTRFGAAPRPRTPTYTSAYSPLETACHREYSAGLCLRSDARLRNDHLVARPAAAADVDNPLSTGQSTAFALSVRPAMIDRGPWRPHHSETRLMRSRTGPAQGHGLRTADRVIGHG
jgi:hypothetical protein